MRSARWNAEHFLRQVIDPIELTATAGEENPFAEIIEIGSFLEAFPEQLKRLAQAKIDDGIQRLALHFLARETGIIFQQNGLARKAITEDSASFFDFQFFRAGHRNSQTHRNIIGDVVAADREHATLFHGAVDVEHVVGRAAADIDYEGAKVLLVLGENDLGRRKWREDDILDIERQLLHATDRVLNAIAHAVNDVEIGLEPLT